MSFKLVSGSVILIALIISPISGVPQCSCPRQYAPVCGSDGHLYSNRCLLECNKILLRSDLEVAKEGPCEVPAPASQQECACVRNVSPVCGTDGITYNNICLLRCERQKNPSLEVRQQGTCKGLKRSQRNSPYEKRYSLHRYQPCSSE